MRRPVYQANGYAECADRALERKDRLKINATIRGLGSTAPAAEEPTNRVRLAKQGRADNTAPWPEVHVIEEIPGVDAEREVEAPTAGCSPSAEGAAPPSGQPAWAKTAAPATATAPAATTTAPTASTKSTPS